MICIQCEKKIVGRNIACPQCCDKEKQKENTRRICYTCGTSSLELNITNPICPNTECTTPWTTEFVDSAFSKTLLTKLRKTKKTEIESPSKVNAVKKVHDDFVKKNLAKMKKAQKRIEQLEVEKQLLDQEMQSIIKIMKAADIKQKKNVKRRLDFDIDQTLEETKSVNMSDL